MATDYAKALKDYGWNNLISAIQSDPGWQHANSTERGAGNYAVNIPGIGPVTLDNNGRINALDTESEAAYRRTGNAPVYNTIWDGFNPKTGAYNGSDPGTYQVSHNGGGGLGWIPAIGAMIMTAGAASGAMGGGAAAGAGAGAAEGAGAGLGAAATEGGALGSGLSLGSGGVTGITGTAGAGGFGAGAGTGLGFTAGGASSGALGSLGAGSFAGEGLAGLGGLAGGAGLAGATGTGGGSLGAGFQATGGTGFNSTGGLGFSTSGSSPGALGSLGTGSFGSEGLAGAGAVTGGSGGANSLLGKATDLLGSKAGSALLGGLSGAFGGASKAGDQTSTTRQEIDPRMAAILYGANGNDGFLSRVLAESQKPQNGGITAYGQGIDAYLGHSGVNDFQNTLRAAANLRDNQVSVPQMQAAQMQAAQINAPSQNGTNLAPAYQDFIYGQPGNNPYLTGAIQKGINQSANAFQNQLSDVTKNLTQNILPSIRSGAVVSGSYGGNREALAQGKALDSFNTQVGRALTQFGQGNTDAAVAAQAGAYDADRSRALSAMSGLSGNQYGVATQNAGFQQQASMANQSALNQAAQANLQSQLGTNQLNSQRLQSGINATSGLLGQAVGYGQDQDAYGMARLGKTSQLLSPYTGLGSSTTQTQPLYENKMNNVLGGISTGLGLYNMFNK